MTQQHSNSAVLLTLKRSRFGQGLKAGVKNIGMKAVYCQYFPFLFYSYRYSICIGIFGANLDSWLYSTPGFTCLLSALLLAVISTKIPVVLYRLYTGCRYLTMQYGALTH